MGWRGTIRSIEAAGRRAARAQQRVARANQRDAQRRFKEAQRAYADLARAAEAQRVAAEVAAHEATVGVLKSMHHECGPTVDWHALYHAPAPQPPGYSNEFESNAQRALDAYQPSLFEKLFGSTKRRDALAAAVAVGRDSDRLRHAKWDEQYRAAYAEWDRNRRLAYGILMRDLGAFAQVLDSVDGFDELEDLGSRPKVEHIGPDLIEVDLFVNSDAVIPPETKSMTASGKLSTKKMPASQFNELYQDYVCGSALRIGREVFAVLPVSMVHVHCIGELLNTSTGHLEHSAILSVALTRDGMSRLRFESVDASDSMRHFVHRMSFSKTKGFSAVEPVGLPGQMSMQALAHR